VQELEVVEVVEVVTAERQRRAMDPDRTAAVVVPVPARPRRALRARAGRARL